MYEALKYRDGKWFVYDTDGYRITASRTLTATTSENGLGVFQGGDTGFFRGELSVSVVLEDPKDLDTLKANVEKVLQAFKAAEVKVWEATADNGYRLTIRKDGEGYTYLINGIELNVYECSRLLTGTWSAVRRGIFEDRDRFNAYPRRSEVITVSEHPFNPSDYHDPALYLVQRANKVFHYFWGA